MIALVGSTGAMNGSSTRGAPLRQRALVRCSVMPLALPNGPTVPDDEVAREGSVGLSAGAAMNGGNDVLSPPASGPAGG